MEKYSREGEKLGKIAGKASDQGLRIDGSSHSQLRTFFDMVAFFSTDPPSVIQADQRVLL